VITARAATFSSRSTQPCEATRPATTRFGRERRCRRSLEWRRRSSRAAWLARVCPMSSRARSTRWSRRPRGARTTSRSTRGVRRRWEWGISFRLLRRPRLPSVPRTGRSPRSLAPAAASSPSIHPPAATRRGLRGAYATLNERGSWPPRAQRAGRCRRTCSTGSPSGLATRLLATGSSFARSPCRSRSRSSTGDRSGSIASRRRRWPTGDLGPTCGKPLRSAARHCVASASSRTIRTG